MRLSAFTDRHRILADFDLHHRKLYDALNQEGLEALHLTDALIMSLYDATAADQMVARLALRLERVILVMAAEEATATAGPPVTGRLEAVLPPGPPGSEVLVRGTVGDWDIQGLMMLPADLQVATMLRANRRAYLEIKQAQAINAIDSQIQIGPATLYVRREAIGLLWLARDNLS